MADNKSRTVSEQNFKAFKAIMDLVDQLREVFCIDGNHHEVLLYNHLLTKTQLSNKRAISKHLSCWYNFCNHNQTAIMEKSIDQMMHHKISYSDKVYIDMYVLLKECGDIDTRNTIWDHLISIYAILDP